MYMYTFIIIESEFSTPTQQSLKGWFTSFLVASHCNQKCIRNDLDTCTRCWNGTFLFLHCNAHPNHFICALLVATWRKKRCVPAFNAGNSIIKLSLYKPSSMMVVVYGEPQIRYTVDLGSLCIVQLLLYLLVLACCDHRCWLIHVIKPTQWSYVRETVKTTVPEEQQFWARCICITTIHHSMYACLFVQTKSTTIFGGRWESESSDHACCIFPAVRVRGCIKWCSFLHESTAVLECAVQGVYFNSTAEMLWTKETVQLNPRDSTL